MNPILESVRFIRNLLFLLYNIWHTLRIFYDHLKLISTELIGIHMLISNRQTILEHLKQQFYIFLVISENGFIYMSHVIGTNYREGTCGPLGALTFQRGGFSKVCYGAQHFLAIPLSVNISMSNECTALLWDSPLRSLWWPFGNSFEKK